MTLRYRDLKPIPVSQLQKQNTVFYDGTKYSVKTIGETNCKLYNSQLNKTVMAANESIFPVIVNQAIITKMGFREHWMQSSFTKEGFPFLIHLESNIWRLFVPNNTFAKGNFQHHLENLINNLSIQIFKP